MKLDEYLIRNGVKLFINPLTPKDKPRQTNSLGAFDYAENLTISSASTYGFAIIVSMIK